MVISFAMILHWACLPWEGGQPDYQVKRVWNPTKDSPIEKKHKNMGFGELLWLEPQKIVFLGEDASFFLHRKKEGTWK